MEATKELAVAQESSPVEFNPQGDIERAKTAAKALMQVIDLTKPLIMNGKRYLYFEHYITIAQFFRYTVGTDWTKKIDGTPSGWEARAIVYNRDGLVVGSAEASCMNDEPNWKGKPNFQLRSMAQTRAQAKALRSLLGGIAVLAGAEATPAEEMRDVTPTRPTNAPVQPSEAQRRYIQDLLTTKGVSRADADLKLAEVKYPSKLIDWLKGLPTPVPADQEEIPFEG